MTQHTGAPDAEGEGAVHAMTQREFDDLCEKEGATFACWEYASRWLDAWRVDHPDDTREDFEILMSNDYQEHKA